MLTINCRSCGYGNTCDQPYPYHAGFGNQGFLYDDSGKHTLVWSSYDASYQKIVGSVHPWALTGLAQKRLEAALADTPSGGRWRFANSARCTRCAAPISGPISETIYYIRLQGSVVEEEIELSRFLLDGYR